MSEIDYSDHPVEVLTAVMEDFGYQPNFEMLADMRELCDEIVPAPPDADVFDDSIISPR